jgi:glycerol-1-phosphate dehydrogenase [NAD(P)+]
MRKNIDRPDGSSRKPERHRRLASAPVASTKGLRVSEFPVVAVSTAARDDADVADQFRAWLTECGPERPLVVGSRHGRALVEAVPNGVGSVTPPSKADQNWSREVIEEIVATGADAVVAIGGGRCLDLAKLAAARAGVPLLAVPTQLSHDGICSPVAVVPGANGIAESLPAAAPTAAFFSLPTLARSPLRSIRAGLGDLLTNPLALRDWEMAAEMGKDELHEPAWHLSSEAYHMVERWLDGLDERDARHPQFLGLLSFALANSGLAMMRAGSSRPASGAEHKISHAIDLIHGGRALHGEQVAFASVIAGALHGMEVAPLFRRLIALELPHHPKHLGLSYDELAHVIVRAPATRPDRWTVLEHAELTHTSALRLITSLWGAA